MTEKLGECRCPHDHNHLLGTYHKAGENEVEMAVETALAAREKWAKIKRCPKCAKRLSSKKIS